MPEKHRDDITFNSGWDGIWQDACEKFKPSSGPSQLVRTSVEKVKQRGKALDIGCGLGRNTFFLASCGFDVIAMDQSQEALTELASSMISTYPELAEKIKIVHGDFQSLFFEENSFLCVFAINSIYHATSAGIKRTVESAVRLTVGGGIFVFTLLRDSGIQYERFKNKLKRKTAFELEYNTFASFPNYAEFDDYLPHHFTTSVELEEILSQLDVAFLKENRSDSGTERWEVIANC